MQHIIYEAKVTEAEWQKLSEQDLDQIGDDLEIFWEQLKEQHLDKGKQKC